MVLWDLQDRKGECNTERSNCFCYRRIRDTSIIFCCKPNHSFHTSFRFHISIVRSHGHKIWIVCILFAFYVLLYGISHVRCSDTHSQWYTIFWWKHASYFTWALILYLLCMAYMKLISLDEMNDSLECLHGSLFADNKKEKN